MRVLLLTQWFDPEPTFKGLAFARELQKQGFDVEVLTGFPNYPGGKIYPGYKMSLFDRKVFDGVTVTRVPLYASHDQSAARRVLNYLSFAASATIAGLFFVKRPDVIYAYHPPLTVGLAAAVIRFFRRTPVVYDIQDMWPDTLRATGMLNNARALAVVDSVCRFVYRSMDRIVVLSPGFKRILLKRNVPENKTEIIYNWCDESAIQSTVPNNGGSEGLKKAGGFSVLFAGNMGKAQALHAVLQAASLVSSKAPDVRFDFLGGGVEVANLKKRADEMRLENVFFYPAVPMAEVGSYLQSADVLLVHLKRDPLFEVTIPSKTQAYMAAGRPVIMAVDGDAAHLISESSCGYVARSEDPESIAEAVLEMRAMSDADRDAMARRGREYYDQKLSFSCGVKRFSDVFRSCARVN